MPITLITGPANVGKAGVVLDALRAHHARGRQPLLVVPTSADVEHHRRELADTEGAAGVRVERFEGLFAEVARCAGVKERPLGRLTCKRVLAAALLRTDALPETDGPAAALDDDDGDRRDALGAYPTPGVVSALAALVEELEADRVTPARLSAALGAWAAVDPASAAHARAVGALFGRYRHTLDRLRPARVSPERQATRALDALRTTPSLWGATPVLLYGFDDFTRLQLDAIETLGGVVGAPLTVSLVYEPGRIAFASRGDTFQRLLPLASKHLRLPPLAEPSAPAALHHLERHLFESQPSLPVPAGEALRLLEGGGERAELELVAGEVSGLLERGMRPSEIAVAHRSPAAIAELLSEIFRAHDIPFALRRRIALAHTATGRALLGLLNAAFPAEQDSGLGDLLAWLRAPGVLRRPELADELELRARRAGVHGMAQVRSLWEEDNWPLEALDRLREAARHSPHALIERVAAELARLDYVSLAPASAEPASFEEQAVAFEGQALAFEGQAVAFERRALAAAGEALGELRELARSAPQLAPDARELIVLLRNLELVGEQPGGAAEAVAVLDPLTLRGRRVRALFLCGLQEGVFPAPARSEPYLSEEERRGLAQASGLRLGRPGDALASERYLLYAAVSRPCELLRLSWHAADDDGLPTARSLFVDDVCDLFTPELYETRKRRALGELAPIAPTGSPAMAQPVTVAPDAIAPLRHPQVLADLRGQRLWSASGLQSWAGCPVQWLVERMLAARDLEPEGEPLARGGLAHAVLHDTLERLRQETGSARITPTSLPLARELLAAALAAHTREHQLSTLPERVPGIYRRLEADLMRYLEHAAECARLEAGHQLDPAEPGGAGELEPTHLELAFGFPVEETESPVAGQPKGLPPLDLGEGVRVRGFIDRVDLAPGGEAVVYDYKSSFGAPPDRWLGERNFQVALYMRAVEQRLGAHVVGGFYQPLAGRDLRARGLLAEGEGVALGCVRGDSRPAAEVEELVEAIVNAARAAALEARAGQLQARPGTCGFGGGGCMYPSICRCDR